MSKREGSRCCRVPWEYIGRGVRSRDTLDEEDTRLKSIRFIRRIKGPHIQQIEMEDGSVSFPTISYSFLAFFLAVDNTTGNGDADLAGSLPSLFFFL